MSTYFSVTEEEYDGEIWEDIGTICQLAYPGCRVYYLAKEGSTFKYSIDKIIDPSDLKKDISKHLQDCRKKRKSLSEVKVCQIHKIGEQYFIVEPDGSKVLLE